MFLNDEPDGSFPKGPPNPLLPENQRETVELVRRSGADFGAAWDGDADRFFLFDETGRPVPGYYLTAFFGARFSRKHPGAKIVHDARLVWAVRDAVRSAGGVPLANRAGQSLIKERMRKEQAVFAGEMSGHFYFRDFFYSDSGLIAFLVVLEAVSRAKRKTSDIFAPYFEQYFISGEINMPIGSGADTAAVLARVEAKYADAKLERTDGLSVEYPGWRANVRPSNTEPLLRVNVEARDEAVMRRKTEEILALVRGGEAR
jgi:phosphomannomutase